MHESWKELLDWNWSAPTIDPNTYFFFTIKENFLYYSYNTIPDKLTRWHSIYTDRPTTLLLAYTKHSKRIPFVGPIQPEPSPIIKKIREMAKRRETCYA